MAKRRELVDIADGLRTNEGFEENIRNIENIKSYAQYGMGVEISDDEAKNIQQCLQNLELENNKNGNWSDNWYKYVVYKLDS